MAFGKKLFRKLKQAAPPMPGGVPGGFPGGRRMPSQLVRRPTTPGFDAAILGRFGTRRRFEGQPAMGLSSTAGMGRTAGPAGSPAGAGNPMMKGQFDDGRMAALRQLLGRRRRRPMMGGGGMAGSRMFL